jgi:hypothetical protein
VWEIVLNGDIEKQIVSIPTREESELNAHAVDIFELRKKIDFLEESNKQLRHDLRCSNLNPPSGLHASEQHTPPIQIDLSNASLLQNALIDQIEVIEKITVEKKHMMVSKGMQYKCFNAAKRCSIFFQAAIAEAARQSRQRNRENATLALQVSILLTFLKLNFLFYSFKKSEG